MTHHTPGPWAVTEGYLWCGIRAPSRVIADMRIVGGVVENEVQANAALIAAAPDLLALCERLLGFAITYGDISAIAAGEGLFVSAGETIAKAKGGAA